MSLYCEEYIVHDVRVRAVNEVNSAKWDALVVVTAPGSSPPQALEDFVADALLFDQTLQKNVAVLRCPRVSGNRLILSPTGPLTEYDDVRVIYWAARAGVERAAAAGARQPALALPAHPRWRRSELVALLGALEALYVPLQSRESFGVAPALKALGVYGEGARAPLQALLHDAVALELARGIARDIGGSDPERMTPRAAAALVQATFAGCAVRVRVLDDAAAIRREYPLFAAVDRAASVVDRHRGCIVYLEYEPEEYERTVMLVGKGVTYDTGGCDIKTGGAMVGMSRDKCGAAAIVGLLQVCESLRARVRVVAALGMVRNSVGEEAYVADEVVRARRGLAVRVGNTDAEGRMVMADLLAEMHEKALGEKSPHLYTVATLTGHAHRTVGDGYTIVMDNHAARESGHAEKFRAAGESVGDMVEVSVIRREDLAAHRGRARHDDVHQADGKPSTAMPRGHQGPAGFLLLTSGLHEGKIPYSHLDIAASAGAPPELPTAAPLLALAAFMGIVKSC